MKKLVGTTLVALSGAVLFAGTASALEVETNPTTLNSDLSISFEKDPINDGKGPYANHLSFTFAPTTFAFGKQTADFSNTAVYDLTSDHAGKQYVVVNDDRPDTDKNAGGAWNVKVQMAKISDTEAGSDKTIAGTLKLNLSDVKHYNMGTKANAIGDDIEPAEPNGKDVVQDWGIAGKTPTAPTDVYLGAEASALLGTTLEIQPEAEVAVMNQSERTALRGKEGYATKINNSSISFTDVDASAVGKTFATKLTWTLTRDVK